MAAPPSGYHPAQSYAPLRRPIGVAILAILVVLVGALLLILAIGIFAISGFIGLAGLPMFGIVGALAGVLVLIHALVWIGVGLGLWHLRSWAWWLAVIVMVLSILGVLTTPAFALVPILILVYLILVRNHFR